MYIALQILFWLCTLLMFHSYILFPFILKVLAKGRKDNDIVYTKTDNLPDVCILMAVYNEEKVIQDKLDSIINTDYPIDKLSIYIGSDNSSDQTNNIIELYAEKYPQIKFYSFYSRNGKSGVLNKLYTAISENGFTPDDIFILTDANVIFTPACIFEMVKHFKNSSIGQVAANVLNKGQRNDGISVQEAGYIQRENLIKYREGLIWGAMQGAFGACYAMRASCFSPIPLNFLMEDFYLSMSILSQSKKAISEFKAICYEDVSNDIKEEFKRKTRISAGNFQNLGVYWPRLFKFDAVAFCFYSHKIIRWKGPFIIAFMLLCSGVLAAKSLLYTAILCMMVLFIISPLIDNLLKLVGINWGLLRYVAYFNLMNIALLAGFYKYLAGIQTSAWSPTKRNI